MVETLATVAGGPGGGAWIVDFLEAQLVTTTKMETNKIIFSI